MDEHADAAMSTLAQTKSYLQLARWSATRSFCDGGPQRLFTWGPKQSHSLATENS